jgi:hypothetical protein
MLWRPGPSLTHEHRLGKAGFEESLIDLLGEPQIKIKFVGSARAFGAG